MIASDFYVLVTEHDCDQSSFPDIKHGSNGSISQETYLNHASIHEAAQRKASVGKKYGRSAIAKLVFLTETEVIELLSDK